MCDERPAASALCELQNENYRIWTQAQSGRSCWTMTLRRRNSAFLYMYTSRTVCCPPPSLLLFTSRLSLASTWPDLCLSFLVAFLRALCVSFVIKFSTHGAAGRLHAAVTVRAVGPDHPGAGRHAEGTDRAAVRGQHLRHRADRHHAAVRHHHAAATVRAADPGRHRI